jgi:TolB-like protein/Tfp pilus assembly protein PilF
MRAAQQERLGELFEAALERQRADRAAFIDEACADDPGLRADLLSLLASHESAPAFLEGAPATIVDRALASLATAPDGPSDAQVSKRYQILERLGGGGMGVVYRARDLRLNRTVALKFLAPHMTADPTARARLLAEARAASVLDHPNVAVIHEIDETDSGQLYIAMACYASGTLRDRLRHGPLPVDAVVDVARQVADALSVAHAAGIIHRDIKPSNVLITPGGVVKLVDFGISTHEEAELPEDSHLLGTVAYMSPEQTRGDPIDRRSDLWSAGVLLYELLTGERPFRGADERAILTAIREAEPLPLGDVCPSAPAALVHVVEGSLRKEPSQRFQTAQELLAALAQVPSVEQAQTRVSGRGGLHAIAVLPFQDTGLQPDRAYLADALAQDLTMRLSVIGGLRVTAWGSARSFAAAQAGYGEIAAELGVHHLVAGEIAEAGDVVRLAVWCIDADSLARVWSEQIHFEPSEIPRVQARLAERIVAASHAVASNAQYARLTNRGAHHPAAYVRYLAGLQFLDARVEPVAQEAVRHFEALTSAEPDSAHAWCGLAQAYQQMAALLAMPPGQAYSLAREAAERALALDGDIAEAHAVLALNLSYYQLDLREAEQHFQRALELAPSHAEARGFYAELLRNQGRFDEALAEVRAAQALNPRLPSHELEEGIIFYVARRYDQALERYDRLRETSPGFAIVHFFIALVQVQLRMYDDALNALKILDPQCALPDTRSLRGYVCALTGRQDEARELIASLKASLAATSRTLDPSPFHAAIIHVALGEYDDALELLWEAFRQRTWQAALLGVEPMVDPLRGDPRFQALLDAMGLQLSAPPVTPLARPR